MKKNYAFLRVPDVASKDRAINELHNSLFHGREMKIERSRGSGTVKEREAERRKNNTPTDSLFMVNYDSSTYCID